MQARILVGLVAVALGGLTSCSNILEENGVINNVAKGDTGELRISLNTDASVNVSTKAAGDEVESGATLSETQMKQFVLTATKDSETQNLGTYGSYTTQLPVGDWNVKAVYTSMEENTVVAWDQPNFEGTQDVKIAANKPTNATISATLTNSIIQVDASAFGQLQTDGATITELYVYVGEETSTPSTKYLLFENSALVTGKKLYVASNATNVRIAIKGYLTNDESKTFAVNQLIADNDQTTTSGKKLYKVVYSLNNQNGSISLTIQIDGKVTEVPITVPVNPYE